MLLHPVAISTERFTYLKDERLFVAEDSDFGPNGIPLGRVYDDACDIGFTLRSHQTGREIVFATWETKKNGEGDVLYTEYRPAPYQSGLNGLSDLKVHVLND